MVNLRFGIGSWSRLRFRLVAILLVVSFSFPFPSPAFARAESFLPVTPEGFKIEKEYVSNLSGTAACNEDYGVGLLLWQSEEPFSVSGISFYLTSQVFTPPYETTYPPPSLSSFSLSFYEIPVVDGVLQIDFSSPLLSHDSATEYFSTKDDANRRFGVYQIFFDLGKSLTLEKFKFYLFTLRCTQASSDLRVWKRNDNAPGSFLSFSPKEGAVRKLYESKIAFSLYSGGSQEKAAPRFHPVVLIHGLGGKPTDWESKGQNYKGLLLDQGYPADYIHLYSYGNTSGGVYNYQGDIRDIAAGLEGVVADLSNKHKLDGGDGKVDLLGYSLGGLVARYYLATHKENHHIRKLITVGTPHKGAWLMDLDKGIKSVPGIGTYLESGIAHAILLPLKSLDLVNKERPPDPNSTAASQLASDSTFLTELNQEAKTPPDISFYLLYGDIGVTFKQKLFSFEMQKKGSIGDGLIFPESATFIPGGSSTPIAFKDSIVTTAKLVRGTEAKIEWPNLGSSRFLHSGLLVQDEVKSKIMEILVK